MPRSSLAERLHATVRIHREIAAGGFPNARRLGEVAGVSEKSARKYLGILRDVFGINPVYDPRRFGYHYPEPIKSALLPQLTAKEVMAVFLMEEATRHFRDMRSLGPLIDSALDKLSLLLPGNCGVTIEGISAAMSMRASRGEAVEANPAVLRTLHRALLDRRRVSILYESRSRRKLNRRRIEPLHLTYCEGQWYLIAFCLLRQALRIFVPARMRQARLLPEHFSPPKDFNPQAYFRTAFGIVANMQVAEVSLVFDAEATPIIRERRWHATQTMENLCGGRVRLRMTCSQSDELRSWLLSWGQHVYIESPPELREEIRKTHLRAAKGLLRGKMPWTGTATTGSPNTRVMLRHPADA